MPKRDPDPVERALSAVAAGGALMLLLAIAMPGTASRDVLSDLDCVVEPSLVVDLGTAVPGLLVETRHERGDYVEAGTRMARLDDRVERLSLQLARAVASDDTAIRLRELTAAFGQRTHERNRDLSTGESISDQALDQVGTETAVASLQVVQERRALAQAAIELRRAEAILAQRDVVSPISGSVMQRLASVGQYVDSEPVYRIARLDPLHAEVIVPIDYLDVLQAGMSAVVTLQAPGFEHRPLPATLHRIDAVADAASATYGVRLVLDNPDLEIPSGVRCSVDFVAS